MKIVIDECVPSIVKHRLPSRNIVAVQEMGWAGTKNGHWTNSGDTSNYPFFGTTVVTAERTGRGLHNKVRVACIASGF